MTVLEIAKKLNKAYKADILTDASVLPKCQTFSMGSLVADYSLYGGLPIGNIVCFSGVEHSGKSVAAAQAIANYQQQFPNKTCVYVDVENTLISQMDFFNKMTGWISDDPNRFLRMDTSGRSAEEIFSDILELEQCENIGVIVLDSCPALISRADLDNDFTKDNGMFGTTAKSMSKFLKNMIMYLPKRQNTLILINQVREAGKNFMGIMTYTEPGGSGLKYYPAQKVRFGTRTFTSGDKADLSASKAEDADGFRIKFSITKNRLGPTNRGGGFMTYRYETGRDVIGDTLEVALKYGYIEHPNSLTYILVNLDTGEYYTDREGEILKFAGRNKLISYLNEHLDFQKEFVDMLSRHISASGVKSLLDEDAMKEILDQESSVESNNIEIKSEDTINEESKDE